MKPTAPSFAKWLWFALLCAALMPPLFAQTAVKSGAVAKFVGVLESRVAYGPPGYGENPATDRREPYIALLLKSPVVVAEEDGETSATTTVLQIIILGEKHDALQEKANRLLTGEVVAISGEVFPADNGHHHEPVLIILRSIDKAPENRQRK